MPDTGRAGRVRVERRLATARHGALLLDRKDHILTDELERLRLRAARTAAEWEQRAKEAALWLARAEALDGTARIAAAASLGRATTNVQWGSAVGVGYPEDAVCEPPIAPPAGGSSALSIAAEAHRAAVTAGVRHAAAQRAIRLIAAELSATRIRRRAVENRWIPKLESDLLTIRRRLDDQELEESLRLRWATTTKGHRS